MTHARNSNALFLQFSFIGVSQQTGTFYENTDYNHIWKSKMLLELIGEKPERKEEYFIRLQDSVLKHRDN
jgi:hypothetical protein